MDLSTLNTVTGAEEGRFLHLRHPLTKEPLWDIKGDNRVKAGVWCRGFESKTVQEAVVAAQRAQDKGTASEDDDTAIARAIVIRFQGLHRGEQELTTTGEDLSWFFEQSSLFVQAVIDFAKEPGNFLPAASKN